MSHTVSVTLLQIKAVLPKWLSHPKLIHTDLSQTSCPIPDLNYKIMLNLKENNITHFFPGVADTYESLVDIVVSTPGRLVEHLQKTEGFNLRNLKYLVIDEADRVIDGIQNDWLFYLEKHLGQEIFSSLSLNYLRKRKSIFQKLLFSATLSQDPEKLKRLNLFQPILFTSTDKNKEASEVNNEKEERIEYLGKFTMPRELEEHYTVVESYFKPIVIAELLSSYRWRRVLCFCKSAAEASRLSKLISFLCPSLKIRDMSSLLQKSARNLVLQQFSNGEIDMLVSTDVIARGIDIPQVNYVISYDPPKYVRGYVHRAGRTGRAGMLGTVLTLTTPSQIVPFTQKLKEANRNNVDELKMNAEIFERRSRRFKKALQKLKLQTEESEEKVPHLRKSKELKRKRRKKKFCS
uniref:ATP-dependent RNA helicase n=1 Tax=Rhodnius prolixus TaxID=13249 RepID=T1I0N0_RHOPR